MENIYSERELKEIYHALFYFFRLNHGTNGHNQLMLVARLAQEQGFSIGPDSKQLMRGGKILLTVLG